MKVYITEFHLVSAEHAYKEDTVVKRIKTVALNKDSFTYNGSVQRLALIIKDSDGKTIASKYYTTAFSNKDSKNAGSYKVKVTFKGNYAGTKSLSYRINKAANPMKVKAKKLTGKKIHLKRPNDRE